MNLFFFSSPYTSDSIIPHLSYILKEKIDNLYLYKDNFDLKSESNIHKYNAVYENDIELLIKKSDIVVVINDRYISNKVIGNVSKLCLIYSKPYYKIDISLDRIYRINLMKHEYLLGKPVVMLCYDGESSQIEKIELSINKMFNQNNISVKQIFSNNTLDLLNGMHHIINDSLINSITYDHGSFEVFIFTISLQQLAGYDSNIYSYINLIKPDFILFCGENNYSRFTDLNNLFKYKFNLNLDLLMISNFFTYKEEDSIGYQIKTSIINQHCNQKEIVSCDKISENKVYEKIISKITFPKDIIVINKK